MIDTDHSLSSTTHSGEPEVETSSLERVGLMFSIPEFDANCYPIRVPCSRWSWMTT